ncbi:hypothetical protein [Ideonella sp. BN130291]|uniref:hypothetical protein n=1 Tax=Ideonella sp. BN130291 TaxID=3112940 RepID=UPI002E27192C|nr:hypothetical protein [Ideonella sp. BN130291]
MKWAERWAVALLLGGIGSSAFAEGATVYRCPGPPILYTDAISAAEAKQRNCRTIEGAPITVMQSPKGSGKPAPVASSGPRNSEARVDPKEQQARDNDARRILEAELRREEERLAQLQKDYNGGEPERQGNEQNYAKYQERVAAMKASITRKEADIAAIKRELAKLP